MQRLQMNLGDEPVEARPPPENKFRNLIVMKTF